MNKKDTSADQIEMHDDTSVMIARTGCVDQIEIHDDTRGVVCGVF